MVINDILPAIGVDRRLRALWAKVTRGAAIAVLAVAVLGVCAGGVAAMSALSVDHLPRLDGPGYWPQRPAPGPDLQPRFCAAEPDGQPAPPPFYKHCVPRGVGTIY